MVIAPFNEKQAKKHQQAWADHLGLPVEKEVNLGNGAKLTMVLIPPGEFRMGSTGDQIARFVAEGKRAKDYYATTISNEGPRHRVRITQPFYLGKFEFTQAQWDAVMPSNPSTFKYKPSHPVENLNWDEIQPLLAKLNQAPERPKGTFGLPSEAQWEYACRAGAATIWFSGDSKDKLREHSWFDENSGEMTHAVGQLKPNGFGLYDMFGNVSEWCADWYEADYYNDSPTDDPGGPLNGGKHVIRGTSWKGQSRHCRLSSRGGSGPYITRNG
jgi:formylglycine-generating enzyme required for sulfatase activity